jgi:hypothetical protein
VAEDYFDRGYEIAYEEGRRWLEDQSRRLDAFRGRVGTLFTAAGVVGGLLVAQILSKDRPHRLTAPGIVALLVAGASLVYMCWALLTMWRPKDMHLVVDPRELIDKYVEASPPYTTAEMHREVARHLGDRADDNQWVLTWMQKRLDRAAASFLIGVLALGVALWDVLT